MTKKIGNTFQFKEGFRKNISIQKKSFKITREKTH